MFHCNPLLIKLKKQLNGKKLRVKGVVKSTKKGFGFLEVNSNKNYLIPQCFMNKVMHGDKITAVVRIENSREIVEPETLLEPFLMRFVGQVQIKNDFISLIPECSLINKTIPAYSHNVKASFHCGDWVVAEMRHHPLKGDQQFYAEITEWISTKNDCLAPWWIILARHGLERTAPEMPEELIQPDDFHRKDLTALDFITIDSDRTEDIDDAIYISDAPNGAWTLTVAIADPTAWIPEASKLDLIACKRAFTNYLPGFKISMLPQKLSDDLCSFHPYKRRLALVCRIIIHKDGILSEDIQFFTAWIQSKAKLAYNHVSDWLEDIGEWQPENDVIIRQIRLLHAIFKSRSAWRSHNALIFKDQINYRFIFDEPGKVRDIVIEPRRIANRMIEEVMIAANICAARVLRDKCGYGVYNIHKGFDPKLIDKAILILRNNNIDAKAEELLTMNGFCALRRQLNTLPTTYIDSRIRRFQSFVKISTEPGPHFGLGVDVYITWTSPIRKYGDMLNHRFLKKLIKTNVTERLDEKIILILDERRRKNRIAERDIKNWLYATFLQHQAGNNNLFISKIIDVRRRGMRVQLLDNGAMAFVPISFIHNIENEIICNQETGIIYVKGKERFRQADTIKITITDVCIKTHTIIARPI